MLLYIFIQHELLVKISPCFFNSVIILFLLWFPFFELVPVNDKELVLVGFDKSYAHIESQKSTSTSSTDAGSPKMKVKW